MSIIIGDLARIKQYPATNGQTQFTIPFPFLADGDIKMFQLAAAATPDDSTAILILGVDYTLTGAGTPSGGTATLTVGATTGDYITLFGDDAISRSSFYTTDPTVGAFNEDFEKQTIFNRINESIRQERMPSYQICAPIAAKDRDIPPLEPLHCWRMNAAGDEIESVEVVDEEGAAPRSASYIVQTANTLLSNEQALADLTTGLVKNTTSTGVLSIATAGTDYLTEVSQDTSPALGGELDANSNKIINLTTPIASGDAANKSYVDLAVEGLHWQASVLDEVNFVTSEPGAPTTGDRYINTTTGASSGTAQSVTADYIYEWDGSSWDETVVTEGYAVWIEDINQNKIFNGSAWVNFGTAVAFLDLSDTPGSYTTAYSIYNVNAAGTAIAESTTQLTEPGANNFAITKGTSTLDVQVDCTIDQDLQQSASPTHVGMTLSGASTDGVVKVTAGVISSEAQLTLADGGTEIDASGATDGQLYVGGTASNDMQLATLTAGTGINITNGTNTITVASEGGGWVFLNSQTASNSASIVFDNTYITDTYNAYKVIIFNVQASADQVGEHLLMQVSTDNGSTWKTGAAEYYRQYWSNAGTGSGTLSSIDVYFDVGGNSGEDFCVGEVMITSPTDTSYRTRLVGTCSGLNQAGTAIFTNVWGSRTATEDNDAIRFMMTSLNIAEGTFTLYGLKDS